MGRNRVVPTESPRMAPRDSTYGEPGALDAAVDGDGLESVGRTGRVISADLPVQRADREPIDPQNRDQQELHPRTPVFAGDRVVRPTFSKHRSSSSARSSYVAPAAAGSARTTSMPRGGSLPSRASRRSLTRWRNRRFTRLRVTAWPTALDTTKPTRCSSTTPRSEGSTDGASRWTTIRGPPQRRPRRTTSRKWTGEVRRLLGESTPGLPTPQAARRSRPLRRREARTARPARVRIRSRKPWVLCRRRLFGWNVRLLNLFTPLRGACLMSPVTGSVERFGSPAVGQLAPLTHGDRIIMDMRHRSTPVQTCQRYALRCERVNSAAAHCHLIVNLTASQARGGQIRPTHRGLGTTSLRPVENC